MTSQAAGEIHMMKIACDEVVTETTPLPYRGSREALPYEGEIIPVTRVSSMKGGRSQQAAASAQQNFTW